MRLNVTVLRSVIAAALVLAGSAPRDVRAQANPPAAGLKALIGIRATPIRQGDVAGGTYVGDDMLAGESARLNVAVGNGDDLCYSSVWAGPKSGILWPAMQDTVNKQEATAQYIWRFDVRTLEVMTDRIKFDLTWQRTSRATPGEVIERTQQMTLREGESRPIDLLHGKRGTNCVSVVLEVTAEIAEHPAQLAHAIDWDVWLTGNTETVLAHRALASAQGDSAAFQFEPVTTTATQVNGKVDPVMVSVYGQLRGRVGPDGRIDVALNTNRTVSLDLSGAPRPTIPRRLSSAGGSGQKNFVLKPGEAVKIILPPLGGRVEFRTDPVTGMQTGRAVAGPAQSANEMSITVQARVR
jgi:hypothetical protein